MITPDMSLERYYLIVSDLRIAQRFADYILTNQLHEKKTDRMRLVHRAFNLSMIVSYCRPFTRNLEGDEREFSPSPISYFAKSVLDKQQFTLHKEILNQRHNVYAHSPTGKRFPWRLKKGYVALQLDVFAPLNLAYTRTLGSTIKSWLDYLEPLKSQFS